MPPAVSQLPGEHGLVEALVTTNAAIAADCRRHISSGRSGGDDNGDRPLEALARYLASGDQPPSPPPPTSDTTAGDNTKEKAALPPPHPQPRLQDYSIRWRLPPVSNVHGPGGGEAEGQEEEEGIGARLYARVTNDVGWSGDGRGDYDGGRAGGDGDQEDVAAVEPAAAEVRLAVSIAEPSSVPLREVNGSRC